MGLLADGNQKRGRVDLLRAESYESVFGRKAQRKRPKLHGAILTAHGAPSAAEGEQGEWGDLLAHVAAKSDAYVEAGDSNIEREVEKVGPRNYIFDAGQSRRIRAELFKVSLLPTSAPRARRALPSCLSRACPPWLKGKDGNTYNFNVPRRRPPEGRRFDESLLRC